MPSEFLARVQEYSALLHRNMGWEASHCEASCHYHVSRAHLQEHISVRRVGWIRQQACRVAPHLLSSLLKAVHPVPHGNFMSNQQKLP